MMCNVIKVSFLIEWYCLIVVVVVVVVVVVKKSRLCMDLKG